MRILLVISLIALLISCEDQLIKGETKIEQSLRVCPPSTPENEPSQINFAGISEITNVTQTSVTLNWKHLTGLKQYNVLSYSTSGRKVIKTINAPKKAVIIRNLTPDTEYRFLVRAMDEQGYIDSNTNILLVRTSPWPTYLNQKSISFNGSQSINIGTSSEFKKGNKLSLAMWIKPELSNVSSEVRLITFHSGANAKTALSLGLTKTKLVFSYQDLKNKFRKFSKEVTLDDNSWHHIALSSNKNSVKIFVDGQSIAYIRDAVAGTLGAHAAHLGAYTGVQKGYVGLMDEVTIFSSQLSNNEVKALNAARANKDPRDFVSSRKLLSWYRLGDSSNDSSTSIDDITGPNSGSPLNMTNANFVLLTP